MRPRVVLITCVYEKLAVPAAARDLYVGPLFERSRRYAERQPGPWYILSGEHGLVRPTDWLAPYDTDLADMSTGYRRAWGSWVLAKLDRDRGGVAGTVIEVHAPEWYVDPIREPLIRRGAHVALPLRDVPREEWPGWYDDQLPS